MSKVVEIVYRWPDGREEVRYRRPAGSVGAVRLMNEVDQLRRRVPDTPYTYRFVPSERTSR